MIRLDRWVELRGNEVRFGNVAGGVFGETYVYRLPTVAVAEQFAMLVKGKDQHGNPNPIPEEWNRYRVKEASARRVTFLLPGGVPRFVRVYDNGGKTTDRYTVLFTGRYPGKPRGEWAFTLMSTHPQHPQGVGIFDTAKGAHHIDVLPGGGVVRIGQEHPDLGRRIRWEDLPEGPRRLSLADYCYLWRIPHPETGKIPPP